MTEERGLERSAWPERMESLDELTFAIDGMGSRAASVRCASVASCAALLRDPLHRGVLRETPGMTRRLLEALDAVAERCESAGAAGAAAAGEWGGLISILESLLVEDDGRRMGPATLPSVHVTSFLVGCLARPPPAPGNALAVLTRWSLRYPAYLDVLRALGATAKVTDEACRLGARVDALDAPGLATLEASLELLAVACESGVGAGAGTRSKSRSGADDDGSDGDGDEDDGDGDGAAGTLMGAVHAVLGRRKVGSAHVQCDRLAVVALSLVMHVTHRSRAAARHVARHFVPVLSDTLAAAAAGRYLGRGGEGEGRCDKGKGDGDVQGGEGEGESEQDARRLALGAALNCCAIVTNVAESLDAGACEGGGSRADLCAHIEAHFSAAFPAALEAHGSHDEPQAIAAVAALSGMALAALMPACPAAAASIRRARARIPPLDDGEDPFLLSLTWLLDGHTGASGFCVHTIRRLAAALRAQD